MKALKFIFQETEIHFLLQNEGTVMVNATEMAKLFDKKPKGFLRNETTIKFINALLETKNNQLYSANLHYITEENIVSSRQKSGTFVCRELAIYFAIWLDPYFAAWMTMTIEKLVWGHFNDYKEAMREEVEAKKASALLKQKMLSPDINQEIVMQYFMNEDKIKNAQAKKRKAAIGQMSLFEQQLEEMDKNLEQ